MKTKIIPFDLETAKKIQAGEIEGRIVCRTGCPARILCTDFKDEDEIFTVAVAIEENCLQEKLVRVRTNGTYSAYESDMDLFIELPEEDSTITKMRDTAEVLASTQKHELTIGKCQEGEEVWVYSHYEYGPEYVKVKVGKFSLDHSAGRRLLCLLENGYNFAYLVTEPCWRKKPEETPKHEFKPFDKVLVRYQEFHVWEPAIFKSYCYSTSSVRFKTIGDEIPWNYCIPYEGNEHLVGTTDKPKEE